MKTFLLNKLRTIGVEIRRVKPITDPRVLPIPREVGTTQRSIYFYDLLGKIKNIDGDVVECGAGFGYSLFLWSVCVDLYDNKRHIYCYDSFQGYPELSKEDIPTKTNFGPYWTQEDIIIQHLINSGISQKFISSHITFVKGFFSKTLGGYSGAPIALLHLDCDLYQSYKECLEILYPKIVKGGIIAINTYQEAATFHKGAKKAIDEFFDGKEEIIKSPITDRFYVVKST
jgi:hypothetical protein